MQGDAFHTGPTGPTNRKGGNGTIVGAGAAKAGGTLYTPEERERRDSTRWTLVQGLLAPFQFVVFLVSLVLVVRYLAIGEGAWAADASIVAKTVTLYVIMITGSIWEKVVFGKWLFVPAFFWEDVFSMLVLALHTAYLVMLFGGYGTVEQRMFVALAGYGTYLINAGQFLLKLRAARLQATPSQTLPIQMAVSA
ncbi:2-vinyl bacteriochlorophyllide hydratase [Novosphingobium sp. AAP83]|uniref:2-vinyl bacteriochlorophyllide hydratase n=1 Tax=Novosphingobium sp. AAP83 TaxID=1523425 RepID=UPI0009E886BA|nr:2-vinyl bacteriochlorophyllide hydratase [Novosphingobium sp. AAP83]